LISANLLAGKNSAVGYMAEGEAINTDSISIELVQVKTKPCSYNVSVSLMHYPTGHYLVLLASN